MLSYLGLFALGGGEIVLMLILFGANKLPGLAKGLGQGLFEFRKCIDDESAEAGRTLGGIYGKPGAEALTPDNQVAELYDPAVLQINSRSPKRRIAFLAVFAKFLKQLSRFLRLSRAASS